MANRTMKRRGLAWLAAAAALAVAGGAQAQWSIGAPGAREAPAGEGRYYMIVFANPLPGREAEFNDWYLNTHLGDLVQLDGWLGAQRFRLVQTPRQLTPAGYGFGYAVLWDQQGPDVAAMRQRMVDAIAGGKSRRGAGFNYGGGGGGGSSGVTYRMAGPRMARADGVKAAMPRADDNKTPRPNRYVLMEFVDAPEGADEAAFARGLDERMRRVLTVPHWMAAQRLTLAPVGPRQAASAAAYPHNLVVWEIEAGSPQLAQDALAAAKLDTAPGDARTAMRAYWEPISPYITKDDFNR